MRYIVTAAIVALVFIHFDAVQKHCAVLIEQDGIGFSTTACTVIVGI